MSQSEKVEKLKEVMQRCADETFASFRELISELDYSDFEKAKKSISLLVTLLTRVQECTSYIDYLVKENY